MWKNCEVVMLSINRKANLVGKHLVLNKEGKLYIWDTDKLGVQNSLPIQHLYILSDEEIKEGDYYLDEHNNIGKAFKNNAGFYRNCKKIIATTDKSLIIKNDCDCGATTYEGCSQCLKQVPQLPQSFIKKFVEEYNKGNIITETKVNSKPFYVTHNSPTYSVDEVKEFMQQAFSLGKAVARNPDYYSLCNPLEALYSKLF